VLYSIFSVVSLFLLIPRILSIKNILIFFFGIILFGMFYFLGESQRYIKYLPFLIFILLSQTKGSLGYPIKYNHLLIFFVIISFFSFYQNIYGFSAADMAFLNSGVGSIAAEGYLSHDDIRPFSLFSGLAEATLFYLFTMIYFLNRGKYFLFLLAIMLAFISGSRGILLGFVASYLVINFFRKSTQTKNKLIWISLLTGLTIYVLVFLSSAILSILQSDFADSRLFFFGSMKGRIFYLSEFLSAISIANIFVPVLTDHYIFDNILITLTNDFGLVFSIILLHTSLGLLYKPNYWQRIFFGTFIIYGFFADQLISLSLLIIFSFGMNLLETKSRNT
jgi:hypothetical protein